MLAFFYFLTHILVAICEQNPPIVNTKSGKIRGFTSTSYGGNLFSAFLNIPFATPPVGDLRFTYLQPFGKWNGTRNGNQPGNACPQLNDGQLMGDEDCLNLNVYVPKRANYSDLPVMVYFYGGTFISGRNDYFLYGPQKFMDFPVILVNPNYRLGAFGFLSTNDSSAYGNYAMLDAILALKWVRDNIKFFGGDPSKVTIFGDSAGAALSVHLVLSQLSKGLFSRAIDQSGSALMSAAVTPNPLENARNLSRKVNCPFENSEELVNCLRTKTPLEIVMATNDLLAVQWVPFGPVVEAPGGPGFLTEKPVDVILNNKIGNRVPMIIGSTQLEGYGSFLQFFLNSPYNGTRADYYRTQFIFLLAYFTIVQPNMTEAIDAIEKYYDLKHLDLNNDTIFEFVFSKILGDGALAAENSQTANLLSRAGLPVHAYIYTHVGGICSVPLADGTCGNYSSHGDESFVQFNIAGLPGSTDLDKQMTKVFNSLWVTFANQGDLYLSPGVPWHLYNTNNPHYANLDVLPTISPGMLSDATEFWSVAIPGIEKKYN